MSWYPKSSCKLAEVWINPLAKTLDWEELPFDDCIIHEFHSFRYSLASGSKQGRVHQYYHQHLNFLLIFGPEQTEGVPKSAKESWPLPSSCSYSRSRSKYFLEVLSGEELIFLRSTGGGCTHPARGLSCSALSQISTTRLPLLPTCKV